MDLPIENAHNAHKDELDKSELDKGKKYKSSNKSSIKKDISQVIKQQSIRSVRFKIRDKLEYSKNKWVHVDDNVFEELCEYISETDQIIVADFLNLFYYFIICYSKTCFKKNSNWDTRYKFISCKNKREILYRQVFDYEKANSLEAQKKLLEIQSSMYKYRNQYKSALEYNIVFFNDEKISEILKFMNKSLNILANIICLPITYMSPDVEMKIKTYKTEDFELPKKKSAKINYEVLEKINTTCKDLIFNTSNMITFNFKQNSITN